MSDTEDEKEEEEVQEVKVKQYALRSKRIPLDKVLTLPELSVRKKRKSRAKVPQKRKPNPNTTIESRAVSIRECIEIEGELRKNFVTEKFRRPEANMLPPQPVLKAQSVEPSKGRKYLKYLPRATIDMNGLVGREAINTLPSSLPLEDITTLGSQWQDFEAFHISGTPFR